MSTMPSTVTFTKPVARLKPVQRLPSLVTRHYVCPSCLSSARVSGRPRPNAFQSQRRPSSRSLVTRTPRTSSSKRQASSIAPVISINARKNIPKTLEELHGRLRDLEKKVGCFVNLSHLKLAIRGLESENAVVRVAVLGLYHTGGKSGTLGARELVRLLLADPLVSEQRWERELYDEQKGSEGALLIRYGEVYRNERGPELRTLIIPSRWLERHNIELLVSELEVSEHTSGLGSLQIADPVDVLNVKVGPTVEYPVHKVLLYKDGFYRIPHEEGVTIRASARVIESAGSNLGKDMLISVLNEFMTFSVDDLKSMGFKTGLDNILLVDVAEGFNNFDRLRNGWANQNSSLEERTQKWSDGEVSQVQDWLAEGTENSASDLKLTVRRLVLYILESAESSILEEETHRLNQLASSTIPEAARQNLEQAIASWSESAHTELRNTLENTFYTKAWKKLAWWKLFWRVDDVGMLTRDILERAWLVEAEKGLIWVGGRIQQAGLLGSAKPVSTEKQKRNEPIYGTYPESPHLADLLDPPIPAKNPLTIDSTHPQPQNLAIARASLSTVTIPPLQSLSQRLLLQTISTVAATSTLSGLLYYSISTTSAYEAGAIAALGLVWSLRRLQRKWEDARKVWMGTVREKARMTLKAVEGLFRKVVRENGRPVEDQAGVEERREAREIVGRIREALERVK